MSYSRKKKPRVDPYDLKRLFSQLPSNLKSYVDWYYVRSNPAGHDDYGWRDHDRAVQAWLRDRFGNDPKLPSSVQVSAAGGLTQAAWFGHVLRLRVVPGRLPYIYGTGEPTP